MADDRAVASVVAQCIADDTPVDWDEALRTASGHPERGVIRQLRLVASLAAVHRNRTSEPASTDVVATFLTESPAAATRTWGHLELRERLGAGTFGTVYRAWDPRLDREVALKLLSGGDGARFDAARAVDEGRLLAKLRHPNVVTVHGAEVHDGRVGVWMEFIRGRTLEQLLREQGPFGAHEAAMIGVDLCRALAAAHHAGVIHRDIKAGNVMREQGGRILLTDFGAGVELRAEGNEQQTLSGTPLYMAPELFLGAPSGPRSDVYSLGVLLFHLVTGSYPVEGDSWIALRKKHLSREAKLLRDLRADLPPGFIQVVERAIAWEAAERFATAGQMEQALTASLGVDRGVPQAAEATSRDQVRPARAGHATVALWLAIGVAAVLAIASGVVAWRTFRGPAAPSYSVEASLFRISEGSSERERVDSGDRVVLGDRLALELQASVSLWVYVINEDDAGHAWALFPLPGFEPQNPLPGGRQHLLPGVLAGQRKAWEINTVGGRERMLVLASPERLVEFEAEMNALARPGQAEVALSQSARSVLRGMGGLAGLPGPDGSAPAGTLFRMAEHLAAGGEQTQGVWLRQVEFENPPQ